jgi:cytochrome c oxidase cbb3-type subunit 1
LEASYPGYYIRFLGGLIFLSGMLIMAYNVWKTTTTTQTLVETASATPLAARGV